MSATLDFDEIYRQSGTAVYRYAASRVGPSLAEDVTAETFAIALRNQGSFRRDRGAGVEAWLLGIATNVIASSRRAERRWIEGCANTAVQEGPADRSDDIANDAAMRVDAAAQQRLLHRRLFRLPRRERDPLLLAVLTELSYEDISVALGIPIGTVRSRISRAKAKLQSGGRQS